MRDLGLDNITVTWQWRGDPSFLAIMAIQKDLNLDQILAPGQFLTDQLSFLSLSLTGALVLLSELGESLVLDHVGHLLLTAI